MYYSALLGKPVDHSISPILFGILSRCAPGEYAHIKIDVKDNKHLGSFIDYLNALGFIGLNITLPYKITAIEYVDKLDDSVKKIGALNTIVFRNGRSTGYNTDAIGAMNAIEQKLRKIKIDDNVIVIGAGGAARAIIYEIYKRSSNITILNIDDDQSQKVARDLSIGRTRIKTLPLNDANLTEGTKKADFVINATPVGMFPNSGDEIVSSKFFSEIDGLEDKYFFDAIFNPYKTRFLQEAEKHGAVVCSGIYMMIYQAIKALELWTGQKSNNIDVERIAKYLREYL